MRSLSLEGLRNILNLCKTEAEKQYGLNDTKLVKQRNEVLDQKGQGFNSVQELVLKFRGNSVTSLRQILVICHMEVSASNTELLRGLNKTVDCKCLMQC